MERKKKVVEENVAQMPIQMQVQAPAKAVELEDEILTAALRSDSAAWAEECGFKGDLAVEGPSVSRYPREGYGYVLVIQEKTGKPRMGTARYRSDGKRAYWSVDGLITG